MQRWIYVAIADPLVVGDEIGRVGGLDFGIGADILPAHAKSRTILFRKLMLDAQRANDQEPAALVGNYLTGDFALNAGLAKTEGHGNQGTTETKRPGNGVALERHERGMEGGRIRFETGALRDRDFGG